MSRAGLLLADGDAAWHTLSVGCVEVVYHFTELNSAFRGKSCTITIDDIRHI